MNGFKNVAGEKAYISEIYRDVADLTLCNYYADPIGIYKKLSNCGIKCETIKVKEVPMWEGEKYSAIIYDIPVEKVASLPDWKDDKK